MMRERVEDKYWSKFLECEKRNTAYRMRRGLVLGSYTLNHPD